MSRGGRLSDLHCNTITLAAVFKRATIVEAKRHVASPLPVATYRKAEHRGTIYLPNITMETVEELVKTYLGYNSLH